MTSENTLESKGIKPNLTLNINLAGIMTPIGNCLKDYSQSVLFGLKSCEQLSQLPDNLSADDLFLKQQFGETYPLDVQKTKYSDWLITKGFEELIKGINGSLIEAYRYLLLFKLFEGKNSTIEMSNKEFNSVISKIRKDSNKMHMPVLLENINKYLVKPLQYESHVLSLIATRNCLVHRNGRVSPEDVNTDANNLVVNWVRYFIFYDYEDGEIEVEQNHVTKEATSIKLRFKEERKEFNLNEKILFSYKEFTELMTTCFLFGIDLTNSLPKFK